MRVFVTGGGGYIGREVVHAFVRAGHSVTALARSPEKGAALAKLGAKPLEGVLLDLPNRIDALTPHDAFVHLAYDPRGGDEARDADKTTIAAFHAATAARADESAIVYSSNIFL